MANTDLPRSLVHGDTRALALLAVREGKQQLTPSEGRGRGGGHGDTSSVIPSFYGRNTSPLCGGPQSSSA